MQVGLFRINLSHTKLEELAEIIEKIRSWTSVPICLDSEGAWVRNQDMVSETVYFEKAKEVKIHRTAVIGDSHNISFGPRNVFKQLMIGDRIKIDFNAVELRIIEIEEDYLIALVGNSGVVGSNKASNVDRRIALDALTNKDRAAFEMGIEMGVTNFSLSFASCAGDVEEVRKIIGSSAHLISKIESIDGVLNLERILPAVDQILIDRGIFLGKFKYKKFPLFNVG